MQLSVQLSIESEVPSVRHKLFQNKLQYFSLLYELLSHEMFSGNSKIIF